MGHSEDDAVHKISHKMKTHWQNKLKFSVLVWFTIPYRTWYKKIEVRLVQCPFNLNFLCLFVYIFFKYVFQSATFKGGYAHSNMHILYFWLIDLDLWNALCEVSPWGSFLFTLQRQKKVCTPGDEAVMKIHKKLFSGIPINFMLFVISPKLQRIWSWNFGFAIRKIWAFIWYQKIYYLRLSPGGWECDRHKGL